MMAFHPPSERDKMSMPSSSSGLGDPGSTDLPEDVASIKSDPPDLAEVRYDLEGSNSCFGIPFTMDDTWTKTPLMEELDSLAATSASAASSLCEDDEDSRPPLSHSLTQWRMQGSKLLKLRATSPPGILSSTALGMGKSPGGSKRSGGGADNAIRPSSPILSGDSVYNSLAAHHHDKKQAYSLAAAEDEYAEMDGVEKDRLAWLTGYDSNSPQNGTGKFALLQAEPGSSAPCELLALSPTPAHTSHPPLLTLATPATTTQARYGLLAAASGASPPEEAEGGEGQQQEEEEDRQAFPCSICGQVFASVASLTAHVVSHALCRSCGLVFRDRDSLALHEQSHHHSSGGGLASPSQLSDHNILQENCKGMGKDPGKKGVGGVKRTTKGGKTSKAKKSLNQKMPCLALALSRDSSHLKAANQLLNCKKTHPAIVAAGAQELSQQQALMNHDVNPKAKPHHGQAPATTTKVRKKADKKEKPPTTTAKFAAVNTNSITLLPPKNKPQPAKLKREQCGLCDKRFQTRRQLQKHERLSHACCGVCGAVCRDAEQLLGHQQQQHRVCGVCDWVGPDAPALQAHTRAAHLSCPGCGAVVRDGPALALHKAHECPEYGGGGGNDAWDEDEEGAGESSELGEMGVEPPLAVGDEWGEEEGDADMLTPEEEEEGERVNGTAAGHGGQECGECGGRLGGGSEQQPHQCWVLRCPLCDKAYKSAQRLALHKVSDHPACAECDAVFKNFDSLTLHEELQHFRCAVCARRCADHEALVLHKRGDHCKCKWCKKWFVDRAGLQAHEEAGPHACGECEAEFCSLSELVLHEKETHLMCSVCKDVCATRQDLLQHTHHACKLCSLEFLSSGALSDHQQREHSRCGRCGLVCRDVATLERHARLQHSATAACSVCEAVVIGGTQALLAHLTASHPACPTCATFHRDQQALAAHERQDHGKASSAGVDGSCTDSEDGSTWGLESDTAVHVKQEDDDFPELAYCALCHKGFTSQQKLTVHERLEHQVCRQCGNIFLTKAALALHRKTAHKPRPRRRSLSGGAESAPGDDEVIDSYLLKQEGEGSWDCEEEIVMHVKEEEEEEEEPDWACSLCPKTFPSKKNLNAHYKRVHMEKSAGGGLGPAARGATAPAAVFRCSFCPQTFTCRNEFVEHNRDCSKGKRVPCNICGKTFSTSGNLAQHKRIHTSEKPYKCDTCGKSFAQNGTLYRHKTVHTKETPFACQACGKQFGLKGNLVMHLRNIHKIVYKEPS